MKNKSTCGRAVFYLLLLGNLVGQLLAKEVELLNVSYDPTREFYTDYNKAFATFWKLKTGDDLKVNQSHGGSGKQARSVLEGLNADVVTLALAGDINTLVDRGKLLAADWQQRLPHNSAPYTSTIVFLVKKGNPQRIHDWSDLVKPGIQVITPNPKTSGGARWNILAAYKDALDKNNADETKAKLYLKALLKNVPVLDAGARGSTTTFVERGIGDVLLCWENEAILASEQIGKGNFEIVVPPSSILAEPSVAVVDRVVDREGKRELAQAYLEYLYSEEGQTIAAMHHFRPRNLKVAEKFSAQFPKLKLFTIDEAFGGWGKAHEKFFAAGGIFDEAMVR